MRIAVLLGPLCLSYRKALNLATCRQDPIGMSGTDYGTLRIAECLRDAGHSVVLRTVSAEAGTTWEGIEVIGPNDPMDRASLHVGSGIVESPKHALYHHNPEQIFHRYWLPGYPIMVGGSVLSAEDWAHLAKDYGLQRCINVESEHSDHGKMPEELLCEAQVHDDGSPFRPAAIGEVIDFARRFPVGERLYVHCQMGGSRSPGFAYAVLRGKYGLSTLDALAVVRAGQTGTTHDYGHAPAHQSYMASVDEWLRQNPREPMRAADTEKVDAVIAINEPDLLRDAPAGAFRLCIVWLNDWSFCRSGFHEHVDLFASCSAPHLEQFRTNPAWHRVEVTPEHPNGKETFVFDESKWCVVPLGCDPENFIKSGTQIDAGGPFYPDKTRGKVVYCSSPDRGLHWLLQEWPAIKAAVPYATLDIFYRLEPWLRGWDATPHFPPVEALRGRALYIEECLRRFKAAGGMGVTVRDSVSRDVIEREMASAEVCAYPVDTTTWSEGFSCTILECCAARACPIVTTCDAIGEVYGDALPTVERTEGWQGRWRDNVIRALTDTEFRNSVNEKARALGERLTWKRTASALVEEIERKHEARAIG